MEEIHDSLHKFGVQVVGYLDHLLLVLVRAHCRILEVRVQQSSQSQVFETGAFDTLRNWLTIGGVVTVHLEWCTSMPAVITVLKSCSIDFSLQCMVSMSSGIRIRMVAFTLGERCKAKEN